MRSNASFFYIGENTSIASYECAVSLFSMQIYDQLELVLSMTAGSCIFFAIIIK